MTTAILTISKKPFAKLSGVQKVPKWYMCWGGELSLLLPESRVRSVQFLMLILFVPTSDSNQSQNEAYVPYFLAREGREPPQHMYPF